MRIQKTRGEKAFDAANCVFMLLIIFLMLFPMWHAVCISLSSGPRTYEGGFFFWPREANLKAYRMIFAEPDFITCYGNTIKYTVLRVFFVLFLTTMTAYPLAVPDFCLKKFATVFMTIPMFIGGGMIPTYLLIRALGLINTTWVMVIPGCVGVWNVVMFRTFFTANAMDLREAAVIDGAGEFNIYLRIVLPLCLPILATIGLFTAVGIWNEWYSALIYLNDGSKYPVQMVLRRVLFDIGTLNGKLDAEQVAQMSNQEVISRNVQMAAVMVVVLPILCLYPFCQKYFVKGVFVGSLKG